MATCPSIQLPALLFALCFIRFVFVVRSCLSGEPKQNLGRGLIDHKQFQAPSPPPPPPPNNFIDGRPKAALLLSVFDGFRCSVPLLVVVLVIY